MVQYLSESDVCDGNDVNEVDNLSVLINGFGRNLDETIKLNINDKGIIVDLIDDNGAILGTNSLDLDYLEGLVT